MERALAVWLLAGSCMLAGCASDTGELDAPASPVARYDWDQASSMDALAQGTLVLRDGCLVMGDADGSTVHGVLVFPRSLASWDNDSQVLTYAGHEFHMGDSVSAGGGFPGKLVGDVPDACMDQFPAADDYFLIQDDDIAGTTS